VPKLLYSTKSQTAILPEFPANFSIKLGASNMNTEQLLDKWQALDPDDREKVLAFMDALDRQKQPRKPASSLGKRLREIRQEIIDSGIPLLTAQAADREKAERRGGYGEDLA
jgi:hypothetical protein